jgi:hypothetical protein
MSKQLLLLAFLGLIASGCEKPAEYKWVKSPGVNVSAYKSDPENGKQYLMILYENFGQDTISRIRYELITYKGSKTDTTIKEFEPPVLLKPKDRHIIPRAIGQPPIDCDQILVGQVWVVKK